MNAHEVSQINGTFQKLLQNFSKQGVNSALFSAQKFPPANNQTKNKLKNVLSVYWF